MLQSDTFTMVAKIRGSLESSYGHPNNHKNRQNIAMDTIFNLKLPPVGLEGSQIYFVVEVLTTCIYHCALVTVYWRLSF